ncbi:hypothetical protein PILCRDRAFT_826698 [Piloderma croceum F 1598]|uniref:Uncharacterized protein n=1 Tax=Piloderma croceum (strain F 1598) TaxID=765440 RepID=A0A0C3AQ47_PILCF|nr:hypothetical protein PILCRDRAFT_826698 [Piloderma croceum F 1598]
MRPDTMIYDKGCGSLLGIDINHIQYPPFTKKDPVEICSSRLLFENWKLTSLIYVGAKHFHIVQCGELLIF